MRVSVIGGSTITRDEAETAETLGRLLGRRGHTVVCGGLGGAMAAACEGATAEGGRTIGILPGRDREAANAHVDDGKVAVVGSGAGGSASFVVGVPDDVDVNAGQVVSELAGRVGGGGGGPPDFAQGGGPDADALDDALDAAPDVLRNLQEA